MPDELSPNEWLRRRRPERFSDSVEIESPTLDRSQLEYQLHTITNRNEQEPFELFARHLVQRMICPNLLPHTGPTGGGDSKVDSETYPVAQPLALAWHFGVPNLQAATERWAFAFSAKQDWRTKVKSDIEKIAATDRSYKKAFFVTNQYVPDKQRSKVEDELRKKYGLDVRIFDRTWILDTVFDNGLEELGIHDLGLVTSATRHIQRGPLDLQREQELADCESRIQTAVQDGHNNLALVEDCLAVAKLARGLERPRTEVEGLEVRAERLARSFGTPHQQVESAYERAQSAFWWYEDYPTFLAAYRDMEHCARDTRNAYDLELWTNLWFIVTALVQRGCLPADVVEIDLRTSALVTALDRVAHEQERPSAALQARTNRLLVKLQQIRPDRIEGVLRELASVVKESQTLVGYPFQPLVRLLNDLGNVLGDLPAYDELFDLVVEVASKRVGDIQAARFLVSRGAQQIDNGHSHEAIRTIGRALGKLYKHESRRDLIQALYLCARAYEEVGLLWAARGTTLSAASVATNEFWTYDKATPQQTICYDRLRWLELKLGRLPQMLSWHDLYAVQRSAVAARGYDISKLEEDDDYFDAYLGAVLLRATLWDLQQLTTLPDILTNLGLSFAAIALWYALGHEEHAPPELRATLAPGEPLTDYFRDWRDGPNSSDPPDVLNLYIERTVTLRSYVLGCEITVSASRSSPCVELGESFLAAIEALLATGLLDGIVAAESRLTINIRPSDTASQFFEFTVDDRELGPHIEIRSRVFSPHSLSSADQRAVLDKMVELVANVLGTTFMIPDPERVLDRLFGDELALERALNFTTSFNTVGNVLGHSPKTSLTDWVEAESHTYPLKRGTDWGTIDSGTRTAKTAAPKPTSDEPDGEAPDAEVAERLRDFRRAKHTHLRTLALVRPPLWDKAKWTATAYLVFIDRPNPPIMGLVFTDSTAAAKIFAAWKSELGHEDTSNKLRISIIRRINRKNPHAYRIVICANPRAAVEIGITYTVTISRSNTMEPTASDNLERFLQAYARAGRYVLAPWTIVNDQMRPIKGDTLTKGDLVARDAWQIGPNDMDAIGIRADDDPIMPAGEKKIPILDTLRRRRKDTK